MGKAKYGLRGAALVGVGALLLTACGGGGSDNTSSGNGSPTAGGTITFLNIANQIQHLDPQRNYTGEDLAFAGAYLNRTLVTYDYVEGQDGWTIVPDMATDTGTANKDATSWSFTLRDGVTWQDGSPVTCADIKYGVSRTFAQNIITDGPTYAISMLDVQNYDGPYDNSPDNNVSGFNKAVVCNGKTITFNLVRPVPDFNFATTLLAFSPVPKAKDTGERYDDVDWSNGPYQIEKYQKNDELVLTQNPNWDQSSDPVRTQYPDQIVMKFGLDQKVIDERLIADAGDDQTALVYGDIDPSSFATVFGSPQYESRRVDEFDPYVTYIAIDVNMVPNVKVRQAIAAGIDRTALRAAAGGDYAGDYADGLIKSNFAPWYSPTDLWDGLLGAPIPDTGNPDLAKQLLADSGEKNISLCYDYATTPAADKATTALIDSMSKIGIYLKANPINPGQYYGIVLSDNHCPLMNSGWGPDWANPSTVIPELVGGSGGFNLSRVDDPAYNKKISQALIETDQNTQIQEWHDLNVEAVKQAYVIPRFFTKTQRLYGSGIGGAYIWAPYGSWSYGDLYVK